MEDGFDTLTTQEPIELDITADGNAPFVVQWFDDPNSDTGEYMIEAELQESLKFWGMTA